MGQVLVRQLDEEVLSRLKARAKANARSTEAEIRTILTQAVQGSPKSRPSLTTLVGAGRGSMTMEEIVAHVRKLRDERDD